jgi:hypothetical protein
LIAGQNGFAKAKPLNMHNKQLSAVGRRDLTGGTHNLSRRGAGRAFSLEQPTRVKASEIPGAGLCSDRQGAP